MPLNEGDIAPDFALPDQAGREVTLSGLCASHDWVVLWWYPKASTSNCTKEATGFRDLADEFAERRTAIVGVSFDTVGDNAIFARETQVSYQLVADTERAAGAGYCVERTSEDRFPDRPTRTTFLVDPERTVRRIYDVSDAASHPAIVLADIDALSAAATSWNDASPY